MQRWLCLPLLALGLAVAPALSQAQDFPSRAIKIIVPNPPGGAGDITARLTWSGLGAPFCFALPPDKSATGRHHMPSLFVGCEDAAVTVNGRVLPGKRCRARSPDAPSPRRC